MDSVNAVIELHIYEDDSFASKNYEAWMLDLKTSPGLRTKSAESLATNALIKIDERTCSEFFSGKISPEYAFMRGKIRIKGDAAAALRVKALIAQAS